MAEARPTDAGNFGEALYKQLAPVAGYDQLNAWALLKFLGAIGQMFEQYDEMAHSDDIGGPWTKFLDINRIPCEGVPWLGQFVGTIVDPSLNCDQQRQQVRDHVGWNRGTIDVMRKAIQRCLYGTQTVKIDERTPDAYSFKVTTYASETYPNVLHYSDLYTNYMTYAAIYTTYASYSVIWRSGDQSVCVQNAIIATKPAGLVYTYYIDPLPPPVIGSSIYTKMATYQDIWNGYQTYYDVAAYYARY